jgi:hypothetical protein
MERNHLAYNKLISYGAIAALAGYVLSGPAAFVFIRVISPQPAWASPAVFSKNYHTVQDSPYYFGFLLIAGMLIISIGYYLDLRASNDIRKQFSLLLALCLSIVFCTLISFNYICQTTLVRNLAINYTPEYDTAISIFSMANTMSLCWAIEMWGYAFLGASTAFASVFYEGRNNLIRILMICNGAVSAGSAILTLVDVRWVMTIGGLVSYFAWNILMIIMMILIYIDATRKNLSVARQGSRID